MILILYKNDVWQSIHYLVFGKSARFFGNFEENATLNLLQFSKELRPLTEVAILASLRWSKLDQGRQIKVEDHYNYLHKTWLVKTKRESLFS